VNFGQAEMRVFSLGITATTFTPPRYDGWSRLLTCPRGAVVVRTGRSVTPLYGERGLILGNADPEIVARSRADVRILHTRIPSEPRSVRVPRLLAELIERIVEIGYADPRTGRGRHLLQVCADEFIALSELRDDLAFHHPDDTMLRRLLALWTASPAPALDATARMLGVSTRTLARTVALRFAWGAAALRRRCVLTAALAHVASGSTVTDAAYEAGYATASAFIYAVRREFGRTPASLLRRSG
jgi:AraC-like DNA-binding protein